MLAPIIRNQSMANWGAREMVPLVSKILRVCILWYEELASAKRPEDASPCAIIIVKAACQPQVVFDMIPANKGPM